MKMGKKIDKMILISSNRLSIPREINFDFLFFYKRGELRAGDLFAF